MWEELLHAKSGLKRAATWPCVVWVVVRVATFVVWVMGSVATCGVWTEKGCNLQPAMLGGGESMGTVLVTKASQ